MSYADGFLLVVPKKNLGKYKKIAEKAGKIWRSHGALQYFECAGDDLKVKCGVPYPKLLKTKPSETVVFSWIVYKSRAHRDQVNKKVMNDKRIHELCDPSDMPFDIKRMHYGGFKTIVKA